MTIPANAVVFDSFARTSAALWLNADSGQTYSIFGTATTSTDWTVDGSGAHHKVQTASASRSSWITVLLADVDMSATGSVALSGGVPVGGRVEILGLLWRVIDSTHFYMARVNVNPDSTMDLYVYGHTDGVEVGHKTGILAGATYTSGQALKIRAQAYGARIRVKVWLAANPEPTVWDISLFSNDFLTAGGVGLRSGVGSGNTNTKPVVTSYTEFWAAPGAGAGGGGFMTKLLGSHSIAYLEFAFGADLTADPSTWTFTDVTPDLSHVNGGITITKGRPDESGQAQPSTAKWVMKNQAGDYTKGRAMSQYWPYMRRDLPIRFGLDIGGYSERIGAFLDTNVAGWDISSKVATVALAASGILRRLGQGTSPVHSPLARSILGNQSLGLVRYWSCEDAAGADSAASALPGQAPLAVSGIVAFAALDYSIALSTAGFDTVLGTDLQPQLLSGGSLSASFTPGSATAWTVQFTSYVDSLVDPGPTTIAQWTTQGDTRIWKVIWNGGLPSSYTVVVDGTTVITFTLGLIASITAAVNDIRCDVSQSGGNIAVSFNINPADSPVTGTITSKTLGGVVGFAANPANKVTASNFSVGHIRIWDGNAAPDFRTASDMLSAWNAWVGELASARLIRLCAEANIPLVVNGTSIVQMGRQPIDTFLKILRECETTDGGVLADGFNFGFVFDCRTARYNQAVSMTLDIPTGDVADPFAPTDDDQGALNDVTYQQGVSGQTGTTGTSARAVDQDHIDNHGPYQTTVTVNTLDSSMLANMAAWAVHLGTADVNRYPQLNIDLAASPARIAAWLAITEGGRIVVTNPPVQAPDDDIDNLIEGYAEKITVVDWNVTVNGSPAGPWNVFVLDDAVIGRLDGTTSTVALGVNATATSFTVATPGTEPLWLTTATIPGDFPFDINVNGEQITVTAIVGATSPQTFTVTRSVNGVVKAIPAGAAVSLWHPFVLAF